MPCTTLLVAIVPLAGVIIVLADTKGTTDCGPDLIGFMHEYTGESIAVRI